MALVSPRFAHEDLQGKAGGPVYRLNSWFSLVPAIASKDKKFLLWRRECAAFQGFLGIGFFERLGDASLFTIAAVWISWVLPSHPETCSRSQALFALDGAGAHRRGTPEQGGGTPR